MHVRYDFPMAMRTLLITLAVLVVLAGAVSYFWGAGSVPGGGGAGIACTMEAKLCPDGSYVGRTGPNCEFTPCPGGSREPVYCAQDVRECADGTFVRRVPPTCEFAECPFVPRGNGTLEGTMTIGPICPVETYPPDPRCKPSAETYAARKVYVWAANRSRIIATLTPDANGRFSVLLPAGEYIVDVAHQPGPGGATGVPKTVVIAEGQTVSISIDIDTGIR